MNTALESKIDVLIADDSESSRFVLSSAVEEMGFRPIVVSDGAQAWEVINSKNPPPIAIVDWMMPELTGVELCKKIRSELNSTYIYIIIVTNKAEDESRWLGIEAGADDYLIKTPSIEKELKVRMSIARRIVEYQGQLKILNDELNKFISILAHDIKGAFSILLNISKLMPGVLKANDQEKTKNYTSKWDNAVKTTHTLFENLLKWSLCKRNRVDMKYSELFLAEILNEESTHLNLRCQEKGINLTIQIPPTLKIFADKDSLATVIRNLISNSIKFTATGGEIKVYITNDSSSKEVHLCIADNGVGMSSEVVGKLFNISSTHTTKGTSQESGTGLGLILCKELIEKNNGKIWVESKEGQGSQFYISIPNSG